MRVRVDEKGMLLVGGVEKLDAGMRAVQTVYREAIVREVALRQARTIPMKAQAKKLG